MLQLRTPRTWTPRKSIPATLVSLLLFSAMASPTISYTQSELGWTMQNSGTTAGLRGIDSVDGKTAWASGTEGTVLRTADGGAHWMKCTVPPDAAALDFRGVQAWDEQTAIVMSSGPGDKSRLYKTADGCKTWTLLFKNPDTPDGFFDSFFADWTQEGGSSAWVGSLVGDPVKGRFVVFDTIDSGTTWTQRTSPDLALGETELGGFAASNSLFPADQDRAHNARLFASGGKGGAVVWIETLPQHSWKRINAPVAHGNDSSGIFSIASHGDSGQFHTRISREVTMVAVGGDYVKPNDGSASAAWSTDGGFTWHAAQKQPHGYRSSVAFDAEKDLWVAAGTNGSDISQDDGKTWTAIDNGNWNALSPPFVVGPKGRIGRLSKTGTKAP